MRAKIYMLATVSVAAIPAISMAQMSNPFAVSSYMGEGGGVYAGVAGGWNGLKHQDIDAPIANKNIEFNDGWAALATVGYRAPSNFRAELELGYRTNEVDSISGAPFQNATATGDVRGWTVMANVLYDFVNKTPFVPYLGVGIGAIDIRYDNVQATEVGIGSIQVDDDTWAPAAQGIVGVGYKVHQNVDIFANYQYITAFADPRISTSTGRKTDVDYDAHTVLAGLRFSFNKPKPVAVEPAPAPAPEPAPEPAPISEPVVPLSYMVFFDFDKSSITPEGRAILETAVQNAKSNNVVRIEVTGHADRAGSDAYNMRLSQRRADAVKKELVKLGLAANEITTIAKGETDPLVPTDDGIREPQNRRVEIVYTQGNKQ